MVIKKYKDCKNCMWFNYREKGCGNYNCHNQSEYDEYIPRLVVAALEAGATVKKTKDGKGGIYIHGEKLTDDDLYECLFNPKETRGDIIRQKNNEQLALFLINITHLAPTWNYKDMLYWLNEEVDTNEN